MIKRSIVNASACRRICRRICRQTALAVVCLWTVLLPGCRNRQQVELTVSVAASLTGTIEQVESNYSKQHPEVVFRNNFGSSGALAHQIQQGAPVDLFLSAGAKPIKELVQSGLARPEQVHTVLRNRLVLIVPAASTLTSVQQLNTDRVHRIALGDPQSVPAGLYALQTLTSSRLNEVLQPKFVFAKDVRQVLAYVESGDVEAGFVYATDARASSKARVAETIDDAAHEPIVYPLAVLQQSRHGAEAQAFAQYLLAEEAGRIFTAQGFIAAAQP